CRVLPRFDEQLLCNPLAIVLRVRRLSETICCHPFLSELHFGFDLVKRSTTFRGLVYEIGFPLSTISQLMPETAHQQMLQQPYKPKRSRDKFGHDCLELWHLFHRPSVYQLAHDRLDRRIDGPSLCVPWSGSHCGECRVRGSFCLDAIS